MVFESKCQWMKNLKLSSKAVVAKCPTPQLVLACDEVFMCHKKLIKNNFLNVMNMCNMNGVVLYDAHLNVTIDQ